MPEKARIQIRTSADPVAYSDVGAGDAGVAVPVDIESSTLPSGASTSAKQLADNHNVKVTDVVPGVGATKLGKAEDAVHASGDTGVMILGVRNDSLVALAADGKYHPLTIDSHAGLHTSPEHSIILDELEEITGWTALNTDTTGITTNADHISGAASIEFDKVNGDANTIFAGIQKTIAATDLSLFHIHESIHLAINLSALTNVAYVFVRLGTDSSNYNEWRIQDDDLTTGWQVLKMTLGNASTAGSTGNGWNPAVVTYAVVGVAFDAETNTLADIRVNHLSLHSGLHTTSDIASEVSTAVNSPFLSIKDQNSNTKLDVASGASYNYLYNRNTDGTNLMPTGDTDARAIYVNLGANNDVSTTPNEYELAGNTTHVKKYYTHIGSVSDGIIWSPAAGKRWYITDIFINVSAVATVILEDDLTAGDAVIWKAELYANSGWSHSFTTPWFSGEDAADFTVTTDTGNIYIMVTGYEI